MLREEFPRLRLAHLPTPLEEMPNLTQRLKGPRLLIKRDDQTGLATGGNKARKLEYLMADALAQGADTIVTLGAAQSNHARQTAAAAARLGLKALLLLRGEEPPLRNGNLLLDDLLGAEVRWMGPQRRIPPERIAGILEELKQAGQRPYLVPYGGSNEVGVLGYIQAMRELLDQLEESGLVADHLVVATSSGGTQVGLVLGAKIYGYEGKIIGISVDLPREELWNNLVSLAQATAARWGFDLSLGRDDFIVYDDYLGGGYGVLGPPEKEAINLLAQTEGILLDPVYTGRAMAGLIDLIRRGTFRSNEVVIFWHTGGTPALFAYAQELFKAPRTEP
ncbi:MAG TPA: D-cysteine desulfhydrase family protein [Chloroflexi bacterium]|nr:D-cysteine desulfhydrase family protein [Chloroflexota bacterium]